MTKETTIPASAVPTNLMLAEHANVRYYHTARRGVTVEMLERPEYWTHVAARLRPGHRIEVLAEDQSFWADALVLSASRLEAKVKVLFHVGLAADEVDEVIDDDGLELNWGGPSVRWRVVRKEDGEIMKDGFPDKGAANKWRRNRLQNMVK